MPSTIVIFLAHDGRAMEVRMGSEATAKRSTLKLYLSRWVCRDVASNLHRLEEESDAAALGGAEICIFPESFLHGYTRTVDPREVRSHLAALSSAHARTTFVFGSFTEDRRNRMTVWSSGREIGRYDKVHLFAPNDEPRIWEPGDRYATVRLDGLTLGLVNCNDIRFPEQSRALRLQGRCDMLVVVGWWPWRRDHVWATLLRARAIENAVFVVGCAISASEFPGEMFARAGNHVFDPLGEPVRTMDDHFYTLDLGRSADVVIDPLETFVDIREVTSYPLDES